MLDNLFTKFQDIKAKRENGEGGFTLIELLVVVVIIGILIAIAIPLYLNYQKGAHDKSAASDVRGAVAAVNQCASDNPANAVPATADAAGGVDGADMTFTCNAVAKAQTATVTEGTTLTYSATGNNYTITGKNKDGSGKTYTYTSSTGKTVTTG